MPSQDDIQAKIEKAARESVSRDIGKALSVLPVEFYVAGRKISRSVIPMATVLAKMMEAGIYHGPPLPEILEGRIEQIERTLVKHADTLMESVMDSLSD